MCCMASDQFSSSLRVEVHFFQEEMRVVCFTNTPPPPDYRRWPSASSAFRSLRLCIFFIPTESKSSSSSNDKSLGSAAPNSSRS